MSKRSQRRLLEVSWVDVSSFDGWRTVREVSQDCKPFRARMVGWEISRTAKYLSLATAFSGHECRGIRVIPLGCIVRIREIEGQRTRS